MTSTLYASNPLLPPGRTNGWVILDRSWAQELGVQRDRGVYRIRHRKLLQLLAEVDREAARMKPPRFPTAA